jgi:hypothetical protein
MTARPVGANHPDALRRGDPRTALVIVFGAEISGSLAPVVAELAGTCVQLRHEQRSGRARTAR